MPSTRVDINTEVFKWARKEMNLTYDEIAQNFGKTEEDILDWENGIVKPTYKQLEKLSYNIFKLPLATFLLDSPPTHVDIKRNFRTLPNDIVEGTSYKTRLAIKEAGYLQEALQEVYGANPAEQLIFKAIDASIDTDPIELAKTIRNYLDINYGKQRDFSSGYDAFNYYRDQLEHAGIFVFQFRLEGDRAFCLYNNQFPIIVTNTGDSIRSRAFSLFHELVHLILHDSSIFRDLSNSYYTQNKTEIFCNKVASEVLVPTGELLENSLLKARNYDWDEHLIGQISNSYQVSREVILRKLLDSGFAEEKDYNHFKNKWDQEYLNNTGSGGGNYYRNKISSLGKNFITGVLSKYKAGQLSENQVSQFLDIKLSNVNKLETNIYQ